MAALLATKAQRDLVKKLVIYIIIITMVSALCVYLSITKDEYEKKHLWLQNDINTLSHKLEGFNKKTLEFSGSVQMWESLPEETKNLQGLRINDAKDMLDKLQAKYKLSGVKTSFSKPEEIAGDYKTDTVGMVSSVISISFNAISDEYIYNFVSDIANNFPGYVQIKSFSINKPATVSKDILLKISKGEDAAIIAVSLDFYWHDLKYKGVPATPPMPAGGGPEK